ncbi:MAG: DNA primase, partial [Rhizobiales bacterium]|nr:DNA primase [Hyphomicrobiales bacterium]
MRFSASFLDDIRARVPLSQIVGRRVAWDRRKSQPQKGDYWACCPFHGEKSPSFHADDRKGRYYCFGCGASGDHFTFLTELEGLSFPEAVERLAGEAGLPMPARDERA